MNRKGMFCAMLVIAGVVYFFGGLLISNKSVPTRVKLDHDASDSTGPVANDARTGSDAYFVRENQARVVTVLATNSGAGRR